MKLAIFLGGLSGGGTERVVCNLANYLTDKGHQVEIITMSDDKPSYRLSDRVKRVILLNEDERGNCCKNMILRISRLREFLKSSATDCYLAMLPRTIILILMMRSLTKAPIVISERADPARLSKLKQFILKRIIKRAYGIVFQTEDVKKWYSNYIKGVKTIVIPNAISEDFLKEDINLIKREKKIVTVGRLTEQKNFGFLIESFSEVHKKHPDYKLIIYGEGPEKNDLKKLVNNLRIDAYVEMPGYVNDIGAKIINASIYVLSSNYEGISNSLIEAMALGVPCISTDCPVGGSRSLIDNGTNGILVSIENKKELVSAMDKLLSDKCLSKKIGINARKIREYLHPNVIYRKWEEFLCDVVQKKDAL